MCRLYGLDKPRLSSLMAAHYFSLELMDYGKWCECKLKQKRKPHDLPEVPVKTSC